jgi:hypothetical protein
MKQERDQLRQQVMELNQNQNPMQQLYDQGLVDENGDAIEAP